MVLDRISLGFAMAHTKHYWRGICTATAVTVSLTMVGCSTVTTTKIKQWFPLESPKPVIELSRDDVAQMPSESYLAYFSRLQDTLMRVDTDRRGRAKAYGDAQVGQLVQTALSPELVIKLVANTAAGEVESTQQLILAFNSFTPVYLDGRNTLQN